MDNAKVPVSGTPQGDPGDIDIFLFSNGEALAPPRKYHLTAQELGLHWDSTLDFLARSHYGFMHSSIDLYTIDGKKVDTPLELANNNTYVAVETKDTFVPGGYDQYLMRASKSWIKRYGSVNSSTNSKEKATTGTASQPEKTTNNSKLEKVKEGKEMKDFQETVTELIATALNAEINDSNENPEVTKLPTNNDVQKQGGRKTTPRSSILRKNIANTNGRSQLNAKDKITTPIPLKRRPGSPPARNAVNKVSPRKESLIKSVYSPGKLKQDKQNVNKNSAVPVSDIGPELITPAKLSSKPETQVQREPIENRYKNIEQDVDQFTKNEQYYDSFQQILSPHDDILKREISTREYPDNETGKIVTGTLETIGENVDCYYNLTQNKKINDVSALTKSFSTEMQHGDVIQLRLNIEVTQSGNKSNENKSLPIMNTNLCSVVLQEKCSQVNIDEIVFQKDTLKGILEELQKDNPDAAKNYVILHCDCCNNYFREKVPFNEEMSNDQCNTVKRVRRNKDYVILLPFQKADDDLLGCKCDEEIPKLEKTAQTSNIFERIEHSNTATCKQTVEQATDALMNCIDMKTDCHSQTHLCDRACATSAVLFDNKIPPSPLPFKGNTVPDQCPTCSNASKIRVPSTTKTCNPPLMENPIIPKECLVCTNKPTGKVMLDKSTQTDSYCFLLEARRQSDGHYSFHLPPLQKVKLYRY